MPGGKATYTNVTLDLSKEDLPIAATFESVYTALELILVNARHEKIGDDHFEKVEGSDLKIKFKGGKFLTRNKNVMEMVMASAAYPREVYPDPQDPTGFWRQLGMVEVISVPVVKTVTMSFPEFSDIDIKKLKAPDEDEKVEPIAKVVR